MGDFSDFNVPNFPPAGPDLSAVVNDPVSDALQDIRTPFNAGGELFYEALETWVRGLEEKLDDDQRLLIANYQGGTAVDVKEVAFPSARTLVLIGLDPDGNETHIFAHVSTVQLDIKIVPKDPGEERTPIGFHPFMDDDE